MRLLFALMACALPLFASAELDQVTCPHCSEEIIIKTKVQTYKAGRGIWGDTWVCPNPVCGYENYEGINYCALCGTKHP